MFFLERIELQRHTQILLCFSQDETENVCTKTKFLAMNKRKGELLLASGPLRTFVIRNFSSHPTSPAPNTKNSSTLFDSNHKFAFTSHTAAAARLQSFTLLNP